MERPDHTRRGAGAAPAARRRRRRGGAGAARGGVHVRGMGNERNLSDF